ncbi:MAG TPA: GGDEF domain-containing protein [Acidimicrobiia bacterium]|nr:GGDEF domain-containing protein [Acidimicrobiia bacterium]
MERSSILDALLLGQPGDDDAVRAARIGSAMYIGAALVVLLTLPLLPEGTPRVGIAVMGSIAFVAGLLIPKMPWTHWGAGYLVVLPPIGYVMLAITGLLAPGALIVYIPLYSLTFVYFGLVSRPGVPLAMGPLAVASYLVGNIHDVSGAIVPIAIAAPVWCLLGELLARALTHRTSELQRMADTDPLTLLQNRRGCDRALVAMEPGAAVVLIDRDHFKVVNDHYGHQGGDEALRRIADALRSVSRNIDCVSRYGGEEFALVLVRAGVRGAQDVLRRLQRAWRRNEVCTFSAGIAVHHDGETPEETLARADGALYEAKANGRNRVEVARSEIASVTPLPRAAG